MTIQTIAIGLRHIWKSNRSERIECNAEDHAILFPASAMTVTRVVLANWCNTVAISRGAFTPHKTTVCQHVALVILVITWHRHTS
eukprot:246204-Amphidinium_carterae.1